MMVDLQLLTKSYNLRKQIIDKINHNLNYDYKTGNDCDLRGCIINPPTYIVVTDYKCTHLTKDIMDTLYVKIYNTRIGSDRWVYFKFSKTSLHYTLCEDENWRKTSYKTSVLQKYYNEWYSKKDFDNDIYNYVGDMLKTIINNIGNNTINIAHLINAYTKKDRKEFVEFCNDFIITSKHMILAWIDEKEMSLYEMINEHSSSLALTKIILIILEDFSIHSGILWETKSKQEK